MSGAVVVELLIVGAPALLFIVWLGTASWRRERRRSRLRAQPFPAAWEAVLQRRLPYLHYLPDVLQRALRGHVQVFVDEKRFVGCHDLVVTDEMRVTVAAQACLLLLGHGGGFSPQLRQILLYPEAFIVDRDRADGMGLVTRERRVVSGESWAHGQVILSWPDVLAGAADPEDGRNVVIHEFAHQFDQQKGFANGAPFLSRRPGETRAARQARWAAVLQREFDHLRRRAYAGLLGPMPLFDPYAASEPAEFFAVASEVFFERPLDLAAEHPDLYRELAEFYRLDPATW